jgi:SAM-dependent methyltransferase
MYPLIQFARRAASKAYRLTRSMFEDRQTADTDYAQRIANEKAAFAACSNVHELPEIFHYWSNKHLAPPKFHPFGITDPEQFFFLYTQKFHAANNGSPMKMVSIGAGNCDMEARLARRLLDSGIDNFTIECMDINEAMLERGKQHALSLGVEHCIKPLCADFNEWVPRQQYDLVLANQCLHHVLALEKLFAAIKSCLNPHGFFLTSDMIGRNGHQRWPEALSLVQEFWKELPDNYKHNRLLNRHEPTYINHDCSTESFEGIRAQDILPLMIEYFNFELFIPFANIVTVFIDRPFGHNFNADAEWDRDFIDRVHAMDDAAILAGEIKPTQMIAALTITPVKTQLVHPALTPAFCVRHPHQAPASAAR